MRRPGKKEPLGEAEQHDPNSSYAYAITLLARRDYSSHELQRKLEERGYQELAIKPVMEELLATNTVNDGRYGHNVVAYRARRGQGPARIRDELQRSGLAKSAIDEAVKGEEAPDFAQRARETRIRKFGPEIPKNWKERAKQARFLQYRGFSNDHIRAALEGDVDDGGSDPAGEPENS